MFWSSLFLAQVYLNVSMLPGFYFQCFLACRFSALRWPKEFGQNSQIKGFSPLYVKLWDFRCAGWLKYLLHSVHLYGFSFVCIWACRSSLLCFPKIAFGQWSQLNRLSPVCIKLWVFNESFRLYDASHFKHLKGFSLVCFKWWDFNWPDWANVSPQKLHLCGFSSLCICACRLTLLHSPLTKAQWSQLKGFSPVWIRLWDFKCTFWL